MSLLCTIRNSTRVCGLPKSMELWSIPLAAARQLFVLVESRFVPYNTPNAHNAHNAHRRWLEYSLSASLMMVGIAVVTAIQDQNTLL
eukprot:4066073-Prymnesium_polylepis.1